MFSDDELSIGKFGSFTIFRINRPEKRNCLNYSTAVKLKEGLSKFNNDILSNVGIIYGEGGSFCSGLDCNELANDKNFYEKFIELVRELITFFPILRLGFSALFFK